MLFSYDAFDEDHVPSSVCFSTPFHVLKRFGALLVHVLLHGFVLRGAKNTVVRNKRRFANCIEFILFMNRFALFSYDSSFVEEVPFLFKTLQCFVHFISDEEIPNEVVNDDWNST